MSGSWRINPAAPDKHDHLVLETAGHRFHLNDPRRFGLGARHITVSTSGVVPGIRRLTALGPQFTLAVEKLPERSWQGPIESGFGWHLVFVDTVACQ